MIKVKRYKVLTLCLTLLFPLKGLSQQGVVAQDKDVLPAEQKELSSKSPAHEGPESMILNLLERINEIKSQSLEFDEKVTVFRNVLDTYFDLKFAVSFILGRYSRTIGDAEKKKFASVLSDYLLYSLVPSLLEQYDADVQLTIQNRREPKSGIYLINTMYEKMNKPPIAITWIISKVNPKSYKIKDIKIESVSYLITLRSEMQTVILKRRFKGLIDLLQQKTEKLKVNLL